MVFGDKTLAGYMKSVFDSFSSDHDGVKALRRLHIKEVHLRRKGLVQQAELIKKAAEALEDV